MNKRSTLCGIGEPAVAPATGAVAEQVSSAMRAYAQPKTTEIEKEGASKPTAAPASPAIEASSVS